MRDKDQVDGRTEGLPIAADTQGARVSGLKALEVKQYVHHARRGVHEQNYRNKKFGKQNVKRSLQLEWQEPPKVIHLKRSHHIYLKSQPFWFTSKQCDTQDNKHVNMYLVLFTRLPKVWKTKQRVMVTVASNGTQIKWFRLDHSYF